MSFALNLFKQRNDKVQYIRTGAASGETLKESLILIGMTGIAWPAMRKLVLTKDSLLMLDHKTDVIHKEWPLTSIVQVQPHKKPACFDIGISEKMGRIKVHTLEAKDQFHAQDWVEAIKRAITEKHKQLESDIPAFDRYDSHDKQVPISQRDDEDDDENERSDDEDAASRTPADAEKERERIRKQIEAEEREKIRREIYEEERQKAERNRMMALRRGNRSESSPPVVQPNLLIDFEDQDFAPRSATGTRSAAAAAIAAAAPQLQQPARATRDASPRNGAVPSQPQPQPQGTPSFAPVQTDKAVLAAMGTRDAESMPRLAGPPTNNLRQRSRTYAPSSSAYGATGGPPLPSFYPQQPQPQVQPQHQQLSPASQNNFTSFDPFALPPQQQQPQQPPYPSQGRPLVNNSLI
ncbi:hypothetical protein QOT17_005866 [Balamuthia mandrillaris]